MVYRDARLWWKIWSFSELQILWSFEVILSIIGLIMYFSDSVRGKVKSLCYMFACDSDPGFINNDNMKAAYRDLTILKNAFPSISQFIGEFIFIFSDAVRHFC
jgi:hypothetical protein